MWQFFQSKYLGVCKLLKPDSKHRRLDIIVVPHAERAPALLYFTGSAHFNRSMRLLASKMGMSLSEHSLRTGIVRKGREKLNSGSALPTPTEESIFQLLNLPYREPQERDHWNRVASIKCYLTYEIVAHNLQTISYFDEDNSYSRLTTLVYGLKSSLTWTPIFFWYHNLTDYLMYLISYFWLLRYYIVSRLLLTYFCNGKSNKILWKLLACSWLF